MDVELGGVAGFYLDVKQAEILVLHYFFVQRLFAHLHLSKESKGQKGGKAEGA